MRMTHIGGGEWPSHPMLKSKPHWKTTTMYRAVITAHSIVKTLLKCRIVAIHICKEKGQPESCPFQFQLLRCEFLRLAFRTHEFERALGLFVGLRDFLLHLCRGLFHFWREPHVAVILHAGAGRNEASHDDVLLQSAQVVHRSLDGGFGEHSRGLLERRRRNERVG